MKEYQSALDKFQEALDRDSAFFQAYDGMGKCLYELHRFADAVERFKQVNLHAKYTPKYHHEFVLAIANSGGKKSEADAYGKAQSTGAVKTSAGGPAQQIDKSREGRSAR